ncbi:uncharacterized protein LOC143555484 [Bidens hawaiensis]|uniref:uncharacterized protein LOC143555484 n=1 Tax=Bidens hawaiensis TaxID=980011 RepID=UPI00404AED1E
MLGFFITNISKAAAAPLASLRKSQTGNSQQHYSTQPLPSPLTTVHRRPSAPAASLSYSRCPLPTDHRPLPTDHRPPPSLSASNPPTLKESGQNDAFLSEGLRCWNRCREKFSNHVGKINSFHNKARKKGKDLLNQAQSIPVAIDKGTDLHKKQYRIRLHVSARLTKALLNGSLAFRGHDESEESLYRGNFIEFLKVFGELSEEIGKVILGNAPGNNQMTSPSIQKELCNCFAEEVLKRIFEELNDDERFISFVHVMETTALSLKAAIDDLFARHNLSIGRVRGQGYDGASNMSVNVVGGSCKRIDLLRESQRESLGLNSEVETGSGKNQELSLARAGDTRWSSHEKTIIRLLTLYPCVIDVLEYIEKSGEFSNYQNESRGLQEFIKTFNFVFYLHLMKYILGVTNTLCQALQRKDQDMLNAVKLVKLTDEGLKRYRLEGFDSLLEDVTSFCEKYEIEVVDMEAEYVDPRFKRKKTGITIVIIMWLIISTRFSICNSRAWKPL